MTRWLAIGAAASLIWSGEAEAQIKGEASRIAGIARQRAPELHAAHNVRIGEIATAAPPHIDVGMLVSQDVAPNAAIGLGLINIAGRKKSNATVGLTSRSRRKPAVTFVLHF